MSELINTHDNRAITRRLLLTTVSALALLASVTLRGAKAADDDADRPTVWIELGGEMERITGQGDVYAPDFLSKFSTSSILQQKLTPTQAQNPPPFSFGGEGKISFQPDDSAWNFQASVSYGRLSNSRDVHHQTDKLHPTKYKSAKPVPGAQYYTQENFVDTAVQHAESHATMDFTAGRDVGLGLFDSHGSSVLSAGIRIAQFTSHASVDMRARPDLHFKYLPSAGAPTRGVGLPAFHTYHATIQASRSFHGIGPTLSWTGSTPFAGNRQNGELTFDWEANGAVLFGRQKTNVHHQGYGRYWPKLGFALYNNAYLVYANQDTDGHRLNKSVTVPNVGGFAGLSFRYANAKISAGYRADFFFNAMDGGIDARKSETPGFYGPFATVSIGLP